MCLYLDTKHKAVVNSKTGHAVYPPCFAELSALYGYFLTSKYPQEAEKLLKSVMKGEKPVTEMIETARGKK